MKNLTISWLTTPPDKAAYDAQARKLANMFAENFKAFADQVSDEVGPQLG